MKGIKYIITVGLFDKDSKRLEVDPANAQALLNNEVAQTKRLLHFWLSTIMYTT